MITRQMVKTINRLLDATPKGTITDAELGAWLQGNASSDVLMALVRTVGRASPTGQSLTARMARLAGCEHTHGRCTGILAQRGYTGHHNAALYQDVAA